MIRIKKVGNNLGLAGVSVANIVEEGVEEEDDDQDQEVMDQEMEGAPAYTMAEQEFSFKEYVSRFANPHIIRSYVTILKSFQSNSVAVNHAVIKMLHRLGYDCNMMALLYQASLFRIFQKIICSSVGKTAQFKELAGFATHVIRRFFEHAEKNDKIFVELFFYKNVKEAYEITEGYGMTMASTKGKVAWTEEQENELRQLFEQYQDAPPEEKEDLDVADYIMKYILDSTRPRRQIVKQLISMGLIGGWSELKKKKTSNRPPRIWGEDEEGELIRLFRQHQGSDHIVGDILLGLTVKRSKVAVINKILELGLVSDRKELHKKPKGRGRKKNEEEDGREDGFMEEPGNVSDEESINDPSSASEVSSAESSGGDSESDSDDDTPTYIKHIRKLAKKMRDKNMGGAVEWVKNAVNQVADDREEDGDTEPIPLIPITEEQEDAVEERMFQKLLRKLGLKAPDAVQERFWRISGHLRPMELRYRTKALDPPKQRDDGEKDTPAGKKSKERFNKLRALAKEKKKAKEDNGGKKGKGMRKSRFRANPTAMAAADDRQSSDSEAEDHTPSEGASQRENLERDDSEAAVISAPSSPVIGKKRTIQSDSDDSDDEPLSRRKTDTTNDVTSPSSRPSKRARLVVSDDEDEEPVAMETTDAVTLETPPDAPNTETAAESFPATMLTQPPDSDSDSDVEDHIPLRRQAKRATIESDSDDE